MTHRRMVKNRFALDCDTNSEFPDSDKILIPIRDRERDKKMSLNETIDKLNEYYNLVEELSFDKHQLYIAMDNERNKYVLFKDKCFSQIDCRISQYQLEEDNAKLNNDMERFKDSYAKVIALRLLRQELVRWI